MTGVPRGARIACKCVGLGQVAHAPPRRRHAPAILEQLLPGVLYWPPGRPAIDELRANPVARSEKSILREHFWADVACPRAGGAAMDESLDERGQGDRVGHTRLCVHDADLDRAEARAKANIPPQEPGLRNRPCTQHRVDDAHVLLVAAEAPRDADAGEHREHRRAYRGETGIPPAPER